MHTHSDSSQPGCGGFSWPSWHSSFLSMRIQNLGGSGRRQRRHPPVALLRARPSTPLESLHSGLADLSFTSVSTATSAEGGLLTHRGPVRFFKVLDQTCKVIPHGKVRHGTFLLPEKLPELFWKKNSGFFSLHYNPPFCLPSSPHPTSSPSP